MKVFGNKDFKKPTHITYVAHKSTMLVGLWDGNKLVYVFNSKEGIGHFTKKYPKATHAELINNDTAQVINKVDFKKTELSKYFDITTRVSKFQTLDYVYDTHSKSKLVIAYATEKNEDKSINQSHMVYGLLNNGTQSKNSIALHIVDNQSYILANVFGVYKQISNSSFDKGEDLLYSILHTFKQHGIPMTIPVKISGGIDNKGKLAKLLSTYIPNLEWQIIPDKHLKEPSTNSHVFYEMYLAKQCV